MNATSNFLNEVNQNIPDLTNQSSSVNDANMQEDSFPETEQQTAFIESAHFGEPQNSYAPIGRQHGEYEIFTEDALSLDDISSDPTWTTFLPIPLGRHFFRSHLEGEKPLRA